MTTVPPADRAAAPAVSVIIPAYNAARTLPLQLEALAAQVDPPAFEVIVVDNGSSDDLAAAVQPFLGGPLDLRVLRAEAHQGASYARNVGIGAARAELLMFCDADDAVSARWLAQGAAAFETADLWTGMAHLLPQGAFEHPLEVIRARFDVEPSQEDAVVEVRQGDGQALPVLFGGDFGARRDLLLRLGGFDQSFPLAGDDNDLAFRAQRAGVSLHSAEHVRVGCRGHWSASDQLRIVRRSARAHCLLMQRYDAWPASQMPRWHTELLRCAGAGLKMLSRRQTPDWFGLIHRTSIAWGLAEGTVRYRWLRRMPDAQIGVGLQKAAAPSMDMHPTPDDEARR
ncbi:glycosyltransferase family 2 protein [Kocuria palustris]|uniref:glycosyltransferase family 2 protein n=1 Tax=Kocuria palustris TaxID=71999 RepID=UPI0024686316|nr:glycosyltransferase family A protein [Kocuria palustris]MDH5151470.1 glycosyltransferase family A protein [Kocuria palustris]